MKNVLALFLLVTLIASCGGLRSNTTIKPNDSFVLGNNEHGQFKVKLRNVGTSSLEVYHAPVGGGRHSGKMVAPGQSATVKVDRNTALVIANASADTASVDLKVTGDVGLSMGYKN